MESTVTLRISNYQKTVLGIAVFMNTNSYRFGEDWMWSVDLEIERDKVNDVRLDFNDPDIPALIVMNFPEVQIIK